MPIPDSFLDELVSRTDIYDIISGYVRLTKRSGSNVFGLCPFHGEKTPSFSVNADKQLFYCFGCGKGGGAISFISEIENVPFRDAVEILARRAGMSVPESDADKELSEKRQRILQLNRVAARYFYETLSSPASQAAHRYITGRGISKAMVTRFGLGVAPDSWTLLLDAMSKKGFTRAELIEAGLAKPGKSEGGAYDVFRGRLMFPIIDTRGNVIGFSGRILGDGEPKYLNSPETIVFNKRRNLFALNIAKKTKSGMLILVEGNIDVIALHQAGFDNAVASLGTALTAEQAHLMSRHVSKVAIAYDTDESGRKAVLKAIPLLEKTGMSVKVLNMGASKDPDEYLKNNSADSFRLILEQSDNHIDYRLLTIYNSHNLTTDSGRLSYLSSATALLAELESAPEREVYGAKVASIAGVSPDAVNSEVNKKLAIKKARQKKDFERSVASPTATMQPGDRSLRYNNEYSAAAEEGVIRSLARDSALMKVASEMDFSETEFTSEFLAKVYRALAKRISDGRDTDAALLMVDLEKHEAAQLTVILQKPEAAPNSERTIREYIEKIRTERLKTLNPDEATLLEIKRKKEI